MSIVSLGVLSIPANIAAVPLVLAFQPSRAMAAPSDWGTSGLLYLSTEEDVGLLRGAYEHEQCLSAAQQRGRYLFLLFSPWFPRFASLPNQTGQS